MWNPSDKRWLVGTYLALIGLIVLLMGVRVWIEMTYPPPPPSPVGGNARLYWGQTIPVLGYIGLAVLQAAAYCLLWATGCLDD